jgi:glycosyltransferase involved in cell wall biosynthesis
MKILLIGDQIGGCAYYRRYMPERALNRYDDIELTTFPTHRYKTAMRPATRKPNQPDWITWLEEHVGEFDLVLVDRPTDFETLYHLRLFVHSTPGCRLAIDFDDDFLDVPRGNPAWKAYQPGLVPYESGLASLRISEAVSVSTDHLREVFRDKAHYIETVPNMIDPKDWEGWSTDPERPGDPHFRIFYGGAAGHYEDLDIVRGDLTRLLLDPPLPLRLCVFGSAPVWLHDIARAKPGRVVFQPWHRTEDFAPSIIWGGFDLAIVPLADTHFNASKSNIKALEHGISRVPAVMSGVGPYADLPRDGFRLVDNSSGSWYDGIVDLLSDSDTRRKQAQRAYEWVQDGWTLARLANKWYDFCKIAASRPRIERLEDTRPGGSTVA